MRPWKDLLPAVATMKGAYKERDAADSRVPKSFVFRRREDLTAAQLASVAQPRMLGRREPHPLDVFALLKHHLSDSDYSQEPVLVWPKDDGGRTRAFWSSARGHAGVRGDVDANRAQGLRELADALKSYPQYGRAVNYLQTLAGDKARVFEGVQKIEFLDRPSVLQRDNMRGASLPEREPPAPAHRLQAVFHR